MAQARHLALDRVQGYATGEVFTGQRGKELGLVDELGDLDDTLDTAAQLGNVPRRPVPIRPPPSLRERLMGRLGAWTADTLAEAIEPSRRGPRLPRGRSRTGPGPLRGSHAAGRCRQKRRHPPPWCRGCR
ncbi:MAG: S49 family peptidase [Chloroflexi bacterium]|nr:S49 family peptidase [Chloroflexota bacterium]